MGKKRVAKKTKEELLAEKEKVDKTLEKEAKVKTKRRTRKGRIYINSSYTNVIMTLTDETGNVLAWASAGSLGFKGTKKSTSYAASKVAEMLVKKAEKIGVNEVDVIVKGLGSGRTSTLKSLANFGLEINSIRDETPIPHGGARPPKPRKH